MDSALHESPIGPLLLQADTQGIVHIGLPNLFDRNACADLGKPAANRHLQQAVHELTAYFAGENINFKIALNPSGTPFQLKVWDALKRIPLGETASYGEIARSIGNPNASRAVGLANNRNPIPILIPCHRIVGANGDMVGYAGEIWRKEWLLQHEGVLLPNLN